MIVLNLVCDEEHKFEGWFRCSEDFSRQHKLGLLSCPVCSSSKIQKLPSTPHIARSHNNEVKLKHEDAPQVPSKSLTKLMELVKSVLENSENVGSRFAEEARKIHYKEVPARSIYGTATTEETRDLSDEGIVVIPVEVPPLSDMH